MKRGRSKRQRREWDAELRVLSGVNSKRQHYIPEAQRGCVNCQHARNHDRSDRCFPQYVCRLEERQMTLLGSPQLHEPLYRCEQWAQATDD